MLPIEKLGIAICILIFIVGDPTFSSWYRLVTRSGLMHSFASCFVWLVTFLNGIPKAAEIKHQPNAEGSIVCLLRFHIIRSYYYMGFVLGATTVLKCEECSIVIFGICRFF